MCTLRSGGTKKKKKWGNYGLSGLHGDMCASVFPRDKMMDNTLMLRAASGCRVGGLRLGL